MAYDTTSKAKTDDTEDTKMTRDQLTALVKGEYESAERGNGSSELATERETALLYYNGDMTRDMPTQDGRSSAVSMDVLEVVEGLMPDLMEVFCGNEDVVEFQPVGPEDEDAAQQETDYVNHVFMEKNPGFVILYTFIKDALLSKNSFAKAWYEKETKNRRETYYNQSDEAFTMVSQDESVTVVAHTEKPDPLNPAGPPMHDFTLEVKQEVGNAKVMTAAPEECGIARTARSIKDTSYFHHTRKDRTAGALKSEGYDPKQIDALSTNIGIDGVEESARDTVEMGRWGDSSDTNMRTVTTTEHYIRCDYDGRGSDCIWRVVTGGNTGEILRRKVDPADDDSQEPAEIAELEKTDEPDEEGYAYDIEEVDEIPFVSMTPVIMPHRFWGKSEADLVLDIQRQKTALKRALLDNIYLLNNQRMEVSELTSSDNTLDDILVNRPGGIIRVKTSGAITPIQNVPIGNSVLPMVEYLDQEREFRSGVSKSGQGLDPNTLQNQSATASNQMFSAAKARTRLIARIFAETGIRDLFLLLHAVIRKNDRQDNTVKLRGKWVTINPRDWKERNDMVVNVGLGTGSKDQQMMILNSIIDRQGQAMMNGLPIVTPENLYASAKRLTELAGFKSADPYWTDPSSPEGQQAAQQASQKPNPEMMKAQSQMQLAQQQMQADQQMNTQKVQSQAALDQQKFQTQAALDQQNAQHKNQIEITQANADIAVQDRKAQSEIAINQQHAELKSQLLQQEHVQRMTHMAQQHEMAMHMSSQKHTVNLAQQAQKQDTSE